MAASESSAEMTLALLRVYCMITRKRRKRRRRRRRKKKKEEGEEKEKIME